ncbi:DegT/DnrJ/EryC1/StrS aminotransferase family protein [Conexibacter sp. CPCC 206217]|uniref:DegT/DnrJ/EryC1/StrS family aminotransferase n=1 Tax=Conexibacter sp. CPCC 206217 TaxID=3064574 RepID=UPI00272447B6|nr:DegT/DnrJ/EryC1/StrS family aminotransferase [Conexibacter sp. CPCC 206217]MDO8211373.1 DegT/DnrJ/EryC1/StrS family aminotransferase [Conexibacter sp. CPCC 206217]
MTSAAPPAPEQRVEVPFMDLAGGIAPIRAQLDAAFARVLDSGWWVLGKEVEAFEREFADACGTAHAIGVASGLDALQLTLRALGIGPGDEVLVPGYTAVATWMAVSLTGAEPIGVDVDPETFAIDPALLDAARTERTRAVVPVHLCGRPADLATIAAWAAAHDVALVEDACQAHGATFAGRPVGGLGVAAAFSFYPTKNLGAIGDGGAVTTDDDALAERLRLLRTYGWRARGDSEIKGDNSRLDELQAAFLRVRLPRLAVDNARRREIAGQYLRALADVPGLVLPAGGDGHVWHLFVVRHPQRDMLRAALAERGVGALIHYEIPPHRTRAFATAGQTLPVTDRLAAEILSLPLHPTLDDAAVDAVIRAVREGCRA